MASLALSIVGTAIGGPLGGAIGGALGGLIDNMLFPAKKQPLPTITTSTYGNAIPLLKGPENRVGVNMIWSSGFRLVQNKSLKFLAGKGGGNAQTYVADVALAVGEECEPDWCRKIWANGTLIFDATAAATPPTPDAQGVVVYDLSYLTFQDFESITVYPGNATQLPDPTIEAALGIGETPAYRHTAYVVIKTFKCTTFGNAIPTFNILTRAQASTTVGQACLDICIRAGIDPNVVSTSSLTMALRGYQILSQVDAASALQPLALCYDFDVAEVSGGLRFVPRGRPAYATIENAQMGAHAYGDAAPDAFAWPRAPETDLPKMAALTFKDPARDLNDNTQSARRLTGSAQSNISNNVPITLTSDEARKICDRMLWEAQIGRQAFSAAMTDKMLWVEGGRTYAIESPAGHEQVRITRRTRGVNGVIEVEGRRDYGGLYTSTAPAAGSVQQNNPLAIGGPVNPPIFIEPPSNFPGITQPTLLIAVSGGDGVAASIFWTGCSVFASTDNSNFTQIGVILRPALMGKLIAVLPAGSGSPDAVNHLDVSTLESGQAPTTISATDAAIGAAPYWVGGEYISGETVTGLGGETYRITNLWRPLYGSAGTLHAIGTAFCRLDASVFKFPLPPAYIGRTLYFKFVGNGETIMSAVTYTYATVGSGYGTGTGGVPAAPTISAAGSSGYVTVAATSASAYDNVTSYDVYRASGLAQPFSSAVRIAAGVGQSYTDVTVAPSTAYTYFMKANNLVGPSLPSAGFSLTTSASSGHSVVQATYSIGDITTVTLSQVIGRAPAGVAWTLPATTSTPAGYCEGWVDGAPASTTDFDLLKDGVSVGTARWAAGSHSPTLIKAADSAIALGDYLDVKAPASLNGMTGVWALAVIGLR